MKWDKEQIEKFKASLSIVQVANALGLSVENSRCHCFFPMRHAHGDRTPSLSFSEEKGLFRCWVCPDVRGDVIELVQLVRQCSFKEAMEWLNEEFNVLEKIGLVQHNLKSVNDKLLNHNTIAKKELSLPESRPFSDPLEISEHQRQKVLYGFLKKLVPVENTPAASYLVHRKIFKNAWNSMKLRYVHDYDGISRELLQEFGVELLQKVGLFNKRGHLRYYRHPLIFPYLDFSRKAVFFQARTIYSGIIPKEQNLPGKIPLPYNVSVLDGSPGWVYLCEGAIDTLTFLCRNIPAVGIPGVGSFKAEWVPFFKEKKVVIAFDKDEAGKRFAPVVQEMFSKGNIHSVIAGNLNLPGSFQLNEGEDINDFFGRKK